MATLSNAPRFTEIVLASDSAGPFDIGYRVFSDTQFDVTVNGVASLDWTVSADLSSGYDDDAQVTFTNELVSGTTIRITSDLEAVRQEDLLNGENLTKNLNAELGRLTAVVADVRDKQENGADNAAASATAAAASAALAATYDGPSFDTVSALLNDTGLTYDDFSAGTYVHVKEGNFIYQIAASSATDNHIANSASVPVKMYYRPTNGYGHAAALLASPTSTGLPSSSQATLLQMAIDLCEEAGVGLHLDGYRWRSDVTLHTNGLREIKGNGAQVYFPPDGTYTEWYVSGSGPDDVSPSFYSDTDANYTMTAAMDVSGGNLQITGQVAFHSRYFNRFRSTERAEINQTLACFGGLQSAVPHLSSKGRTRIEGFAHPFYVPDLFTPGDSRQFARRSGEWEVEFCLSELGYFGTSSNGGDDTDMQLYANRSAPYGNVDGSEVTGTNLAFGYFFSQALTSKTGSATTDAEDATVDVTSGSATITFSDDVSGFLASGDMICIEDAATRTNTDAIPLVTEVLTVAGDGLSATVHADALPSQTATGLAWYYRPPLIEISNSHLQCHNSYFEGFRDSILLGRRGSFSGFVKGGGERLSGRGQALFSTNSESASVTIEAENELIDSAGLGYIVAFGALVRNSDSVDASIGAEIKLHVPSTDTLKVLPIHAFKPTSFANTYSLQSAAIDNVNIEINYTDKKVFGSFAGFGSLNGEFVAATEFRGQQLGLGFALSTSASVGTVVKEVDVDNTVTEIYNYGQFGGDGVYDLRGMSDDGVESFSATLILRNGDTFTILDKSEDGVTFTINNTPTPSVARLQRGSAGTKTYSVNYTPLLLL